MINIILRLLGLLTRVNAHTRNNGATHVVRYWRR